VEHITWSFVTQIFNNGQPSHGGDGKTFEVMISTQPRGTLGSVASLLAATLYQGHPGRNYKFWNIASTERDILYIWNCPDSEVIFLLFILFDPYILISLIPIRES